MQTWEDSIGNINNPSYEYWSSVISNHTAVTYDQNKNANYLIDLSDDDTKPD